MERNSNILLQFGLVWYVWYSMYICTLSARRLLIAIISTVDFLSLFLLKSFSIFCFHGVLKNKLSSVSRSNVFPEISPLKALIDVYGIHVNAVLLPLNPCIYIYIYIYLEREKKKERERERKEKEKE